MPVAAEPTLSAIRIYPVKSCHCVQLDECEIGALGPKHDRRFMFIEESNKRFITQRYIQHIYARSSSTFIIDIHTHM